MSYLIYYASYGTKVNINCNADFIVTEFTEWMI
jgi:hypothetical protein